MQRKRALVPLLAAAAVLLAAFCLPELDAWRQDAARPGRETFDGSALSLELDGGMTYPRLLELMARMDTPRVTAEPEQMRMGEEEVTGRVSEVVELWFLQETEEVSYSPERWLSNEMPEPVGMWYCWANLEEAEQYSIWISLFLDDESGRLLRIGWSGTDRWQSALWEACDAQGWEVPTADGETGTPWEQEAWAMLTLFLEGKTEGAHLTDAYDNGGIEYYLFTCQVDGEEIPFQIEVAETYWTVNSWRWRDLYSSDEVVGEPEASEGIF